MIFYCFANLRSHRKQRTTGVDYHTVTRSQFHQSQYTDTRVQIIQRGRTFNVASDVDSKLYSDFFTQDYVPISLGTHNLFEVQRQTTKVHNIIISTQQKGSSLLIALNQEISSYK